MVITYNRSFMFSLRFWWKNLEHKIRPVSPTELNTLKAVGILKSLRGKRGGLNYQWIHNTRRIPTISSSPNYFARTLARSQNSANPGNLLDIQKQPDFERSTNNYSPRSPIPTIINQHAYKSISHAKQSTVNFGILKHLKKFKHTKVYGIPTILSTNVRALPKKVDEIQQIAQLNSIRAICLTESWLSSNIPDSCIAIPGFNLFLKRPSQYYRWGSLHLS